MLTIENSESGTLYKRDESSKDLPPFSTESISLP